MYMCLCKGLTDHDVRQAAASGADTAEELIKTFGLHDSVCCGRCVRNIHEYVAIATSTPCHQTSLVS
jgi:bacterioferritin-associated ferredoxin